ncbi:TetR family transcriptional regulator [Nocardia sp. NPDC052278]|uniref:TetR/AcrR family transcriptional regulator n=1 Tax=unclassified Nocardia TaxID=2637762 RepID=UPI003691FFD3
MADDDTTPQTRRRRGRPRGTTPTGSGTTKEQVLDAAREQFAQKGYKAATIRGIAAAAGVDAALVHHVHGTKAALFAASMRLPEEAVRTLPLLLLDTDRDHLGARVVRFYLGLWENPTTNRQLRMTLASGVTDGHAAALLREFLTSEILAPILAADQRADVALRTQLAASHLVGLAIARYILAVEPLATTDLDDLTAIVAPSIQHYLTGRLAGH